MKSYYNTELDYLITGYLGKSCSENEKKRLFDLLGEIQFDNLSLKVLLSELEKFKDEEQGEHLPELEALYARIETEIVIRELKENQIKNAGRKRRAGRMIMQGLGAAAVVFIAFFLGTKINKQGEPGHPGSLPAFETINLVKAPLGAKAELILSDGTEIILNAGSTISYRNSFNSTNRDLLLEGEAYFRVSKNYDLPLIVNAGDLNIRATGTEFNVKAYSEEGIIETTLVQGEVEISQKNDKKKENVLVLKPNQKAIYAEEAGQLMLEKKNEAGPQVINNIKPVTENLAVSLKTDVEQETAWTLNKLIIRSENLESLSTKLKRKYNVSFVFRDEDIKKHRFSGVLLDETFSQVMDVIMLTAPVDYEMDGRTVYLFSNKTREK